MTKHIELTQDKIALVDEDIFEYLSQYKWYYGKGYAVKSGKSFGTRAKGTFIQSKLIILHRFIYEYYHGSIPEGLQIDHVNQDKLDNRLENLRLATCSQNNQNKPKNKDSTSGFKGVCWDYDPTIGAGN